MSMVGGTPLGACEIRLLGTGGVAQVCRTGDSQRRGDLAIETPPELFACDAERLTRFRRQAQVIACANQAHSRCRRAPTSIVEHVQSPNVRWRTLVLTLTLVAYSPHLGFTQTVTFTDDPIVAGVTVIRAVHLQELRAAVRALRDRHRLPAVAFTDPALTAGITAIRGLHLVQLRAALEAVYDALGRPRPTYTDPAIGLGVTVVKAVHIMELRNAIKLADGTAFTSRTGSWRGQTSQSNAAFALYVDSRGVIGTEFVVSGGGANCLLFGASDVEPPAAITSDTFSFNLSAPNLVTGVVAGSFSGTTSASGTIVVNFPSSPAHVSCMNPLNVTWTAMHIDPGPIPVMIVAATDGKASEVGGDEGSFTITRSGSVAEGVSVRFGLTGTATPGVDYESLTTAVIPAGQSSITVAVRAIPDIVVEPAETVILTLSEAAPYEVGSPASASVTITDPPVPIVTVVATDGHASEAGLTTGAFTFTRTGNTALSLAVRFTMSGTATAGFDYDHIFAPVVIPAGQAAVTVSVLPKQDISPEADETVVLTLTDEPSYDLGAPAMQAAMVTIASDD
jgi:hypothetical protein